jgi:hypothetical protein
MIKNNCFRRKGNLNTTNQSVKFSNQPINQAAAIEGRSFSFNQLNYNQFVKLGVELNDKKVLFQEEIQSEEIQSIS